MEGGSAGQRPAYDLRGRSIATGLIGPVAIRPCQVDTLVVGRRERALVCASRLRASVRGDDTVARHVGMPSDWNNTWEAYCKATGDKTKTMAVGWLRFRTRDYSWGLSSVHLREVVARGSLL